MKRVESIIGRIMELGTWLAIMIIIIGSMSYLFQHSFEPMDLEMFQRQPLLISFSDSWHRMILLSSRGVIEVGLFALVFVQILRVGLTIWYFETINDWIFTGISLLILSIILGNFVWRL